MSSSGACRKRAICRLDVRHKIISLSGWPLACCWTPFALLPICVVHPRSWEATAHPLITRTQKTTTNLAPLRASNSRGLVRSRRAARTASASHRLACKGEACRCPLAATLRAKPPLAALPSRAPPESDSRTPPPPPALPPPAPNSPHRSP